jgi:sec-independent protein translocase protein TatB
MFDIGFSELIIIGIVALVVIGPERLPKVARTAGLLLGRLQRYVNDVKADINREMQLDELRKLQADMQESARDLETRLNSEIQTIGKDVEQAVRPAGEAPRAQLHDEPAQRVTEEFTRPAMPEASAPTSDTAVSANDVPKT